MCSKDFVNSHINIYQLIVIVFRSDSESKMQSNTLVDTIDASSDRIRVFSPAILPSTFWRNLVALEKLGKFEKWAKMKLFELFDHKKHWRCQKVDGGGGVPLVCVLPSFCLNIIYSFINSSFKVISSEVIFWDFIFDIMESFYMLNSISKFCTKSIPWLQ